MQTGGGDPPKPRDWDESLLLTLSMMGKDLELGENAYDSFSKSLLDRFILMDLNVTSC